MAPSTIRKAIGAVKDQTSIGIAKVASNMAPELEVAIVKATSHDDDPADQKYVREILNLMSYSRGYVSVCIAAVSKRLSKTRDWIVALKALMLVQRLLAEGNPEFNHEMLYASRRGTRLLNMADFRDEAHSSSWDHSAFVRAFSLYLDQKLELMLYQQKDERGGKGYDYEYSGGFRDEFSSGLRRTRSFGEVSEIEKKMASTTVTPLREMPPERIFEKMGHLQRLLDRFLSCRPTGLGKNSRMILIALYPIAKESFQLYAEICEVLAVLLDRFFDMEYKDCVKAFDCYAIAGKQIDELIGLYNWCKDTGIARSSEYPEVQRITGKVLETLEEFVRDRGRPSKSPEKKQLTASSEEPKLDMNEIKALPPPESHSPKSISELRPKPEVAEDLVNLRDEGVSAVNEENKLALALFAGTSKSNESWEAFPSDDKVEMTSAWQNPAAESGKADWELALVETAGHLAKQKVELGGGFDPLLLNGMYDQGIVRQHTSTAQMSGGSASSVALPGGGKGTTPVLALPAPDGTVQTVGHDPFSASLSFAPPSYVQMAEMERKQQLLSQEQMMWQQYARGGMQGQASLAKINAGYGAPGVLPMSGYYHPPY